MNDSLSNYFPSNGTIIWLETTYPYLKLTSVVETSHYTSRRFDPIELTIETLERIQLKKLGIKKQIFYQYNYTGGRKRTILPILSSIICISRIFYRRCIISGNNSENYNNKGERRTTSLVRCYGNRLSKR